MAVLLGLGAAATKLLRAGKGRARAYRETMLITFRAQTQRHAMRWLVALLGLQVSTATLAATSYSLNPGNVQEHTPVVLRIDDTSGCHRAESFTITRSGQTIAVQLTMSDVAECEAAWLTPRDIPLGSFARGTYRVTVTECVNAPVDPCTLRQSLALIVDNGQPHSVPAASWPGLTALVLMILVAGRRVRFQPRFR